MFTLAMPQMDPILAYSLLHICRDLKNKFPKIGFQCGFAPIDKSFNVTAQKINRTI